MSLGSPTMDHLFIFQLMLTPPTRLASQGCCSTMPKGLPCQELPPDLQYTSPSTSTPSKLGILMGLYSRMCSTFSSRKLEGRSLVSFIYLSLSILQVVEIILLVINTKKGIPSLSSGSLRERKERDFRQKL